MGAVSASLTRPHDADQITLGLGRVAFYCICRVPTASRGLSPRMEVGAYTARDFPPNKRRDGPTGEPTHQRTRDRDGQPGRDGLIASSRLIALVGGSGRHEPPSASMSHIRLGHLFIFAALSWRRHAHSRVGLSAERHFGELGIRFWIQQGTIREELRDSGYVINS